MDSRRRQRWEGTRQWALPLALFIGVGLLGPRCPVAAQTPPVSGTIYAYAGGGPADGVLAADAVVDPRGLAALTVGGVTDLYIADLFNSRVRRVSGQTGRIDTLAGTGETGYGGDNALAVNALLNWPNDVAVSATRTVYIADTYNNRIRKVDPSGIITTFAGTGLATFGGDSGPATQAALNNPFGVALDSAGNLYIADLGNNRIRKVALNGIITTVAGTGDRGFGGDGGAATAAQLAGPSDVAVASDGTLYIADYQNQRIRQVDVNGIITTVAGSGPGGFAGDGGPATAAWLNSPYQVAVDSTKTVYIADNRNTRIRRVDAVTQTISTLAGTGASADTGDEGPAAQAPIYPPYGVTTGPGGTVYVASGLNQAVSQHNRVRRIDGNKVIHAWVGGHLGDGGAAIDALINARGSTQVATATGNPTLYFADGGNHRVRRIDGDTGDISTVAGTGTPGYTGDGGPALSATLTSPLDVAVGAGGTLYIADTLNNVVRRVSPSGTISTVAGTGIWGYSGDGGSATQAQLAYPYGVSVDAANNLYIADFSNNRIRRVSPAGIIQTVAGTGVWGASGDGGPATAAQLKNPTDVVVGPDGSLYIADYLSQRVRRVDTSGIITTVAGSGITGFLGDGGPATAARFNNPFQVALDAAGNLFIADLGNRRIRRVDALTGVVFTVAGNGQIGIQGDGGPAVLANLSAPNGISIDPTGAFLFISVPDDARVRLVLLSTTAGTATPTRTPTRTSTPSSTPTPVLNSLGISGKIQYFSNGLPVGGATVQLQGANPRAVTTDGNGQFAFTALSGGNWQIQPQKTGDRDGAISALDAVYALQAAVNQRTLNAAQQLACDVTGDGNVTALDATVILQYAVGLISSFPATQSCGSDWIFMPTVASTSTQQPTAPQLSSSQCQNGAIAYRPLTAQAVNQNFSAAIFGDCSGNWGGSGLAAAATTADTPSSAVRLGTLRRRGHRVAVAVYVDRPAQFQSLDLSVRYDATQLAAPLIRRPHSGRDALVVVNSGDPGTLHLALASLAPLGSGPLIVLEFHTTSRHLAPTSIGILHALVGSE